MSIDAHFVVGDGHAVCQDYALVRATGPLAFAVVCDGCSSSPNTDVGARILALSIAATMGCAGVNMARALARARALCRAAALPLTALDATAMVIERRTETLAVSIFGDGYLGVRSREGALDVVNIASTSGAPHYPAYSLEPDRQRAYLDAGLDGYTVETRGGDVPEPVRRDGGLYWEFAPDEAAAVFVASDGVGAVHDTEGCLVPAPVVFAKLCPTDVSHGAFVRRRLRRFAGRELAALQWRTADDLALAAVSWTRGPGDAGQ